MTRTHALLKLLDHGPLTMGEIVTITGWTARSTRKTVSHLSETGRIQSAGRKWTVQ
jgi:predicted transcriptional regulator